MNKTKNRFNFIREDENFIWESDSVKFVLSEPRIQGFDDYVPLKDINGIMYFYYNVEIYKKIYDSWDEEKDLPIYKWEKIASRWTHDFPCILQLQWILEHILDLDTRVDGEKHEYRSGKIEYSRRFCTEGFACDDFYEVTKYVDDKNENPNYIIYLGCTFDGNGDLESNGIRTPYVHQKDVEELKKCVDSFLDYAILYHNQKTLGYNSLASSDKEIIDGKLYQYTIENNQVNKNKIDSIYIIGDELELTMLETDENGEEHSNEHKIIIKEIRDGFVISENNEKYDITKILFIMDEVPDHKKYYNIEEVTKDFISIMTEYENNDFKSMTEEKLFKKYVDAIINRTWMCWDDTHDFPVLIPEGESDWNIENAKAVVKIIIKNIKEVL